MNGILILDKKNTSNNLISYKPIYKLVQFNRKSI